MTHRSRLILVAAVLLAIGVAVSAALLLTGAERAGTIEGQTVTISIIAILTGAVSVPIIYFAKIRKNKTEKLLDGEYFEGYETIKDALFASHLPWYTIREILDDVLDLMVTARHEGKPLADVIADPHGFALEIIEEYGGKKKYGLLNFLDSLVYMGGFILGASLVLWLEEPGLGFFSVSVDTGMLIFFAVVSFWLVPYIKLNAAVRPKIIFLPIAVGVCFIAAAEVMRRFFYDSGAVQWFLDGQVNVISNAFILIVFLIAIPALVLAKSLLKKSGIERIGDARHR